MRNKSDIVFACIMMAFFGFAILNVPEGGSDFQTQLTQNTNTFATNLAADYNSAVQTGTVTTTDGLNQIAPAAGDATPAAPQADADAQTAPLAVETAPATPAVEAPVTQDPAL